MILKKPYAFLIKHFRLIHLLLSCGLIYIAIKTTSIVTVFRSFVKNGYYEGTNNIAGTTINFYMYIIILIVLALGITIYILFKEKNKPRKFYVSLIIYYIILFIMITIFFNVFKTMETTTIDTKTLIVYQDLSLIVSLPQFYFLILTLLRGIGFDYKKFNFSKDISEMQVEAKDNEEFELNVNVEGYKIKRTIRRTLRELKYYAIENTFIVICIGVVVIASITTIALLNRRVYSKTYKEEQTFSIGTFKINLLDSILTPYSYNGDTIIKDKYFLTVLYNVENVGYNSQALNLDDFRLIVNNKNVYPSPNNREFFIDIGTPYYGSKFKSQTSNNITMVYELTKDQIYDTYLLKVSDNPEYYKGQIIAKYKQLKLKPTKIMNIKQNSEASLNEQLNFKDSTIKNSTLLVESYNFTNSYIYNYNFCVTEDNCYKSTDIVDASYKTKTEKTLLIFAYNLNLDETTAYYSNITNPRYFFNNFMKVKYNLNGKTLTANVVNKTPNNLKDVIVLEVDSTLEKATNLFLNFTIRNQEYNIILK